MKVKIGDYFIQDFTLKDAPSIAEYADNPKIAANLRDLFPQPYTLANAEFFISSLLENSLQTNFAIADSEKAIGSIGLMLNEDIHRFTAELGYWLAEPFWGEGIMTQAVQAIVDIGFNDFGLYRIYAEPFEHNTASIKVLEKAGFTFEGTIRAGAFKNDKVLNQKLYAVINEGII